MQHKRWSGIGWVILLGVLGVQIAFAVGGVDEESSLAAPITVVLSVLIGLGTLLLGAGMARAAYESLEDEGGRPCAKMVGLSGTVVLVAAIAAVACVVLVQIVRAVVDVIGPDLRDYTGPVVGLLLVAMAVFTLVGVVLVVASWVLRSRVRE